ncbi:helix-turn-helix transcriptional regulator [Paenibacillus glycanilyticus]|uniref:helix-turn-helix transcriptional regulator n=1 Tax=Paenibacillus glycanilyticus TaxID=126569 RepID=UPI0019100F37|nr:helix-turn-helix transcriptional regulator [Paenibacillus glycanilyticus]
MKITVKAARVNSNMKAKDVAVFLKLALVTYSRKENGKSRFYADEIARLSELFKVPYENFFEAACPVRDTKGDVPLSYEG